MCPLHIKARRQSPDGLPDVIPGVAHQANFMPTFHDDNDIPAKFLAGSGEVFFMWSWRDTLCMHLTATFKLRKPNGVARLAISTPCYHLTTCMVFCAFSAPVFVISKDGNTLVILCLLYSIAVSQESISMYSANWAAKDSTF
jgi:hypothetical protein